MACALAAAEAGAVADAGAAADALAAAGAGAVGASRRTLLQRLVPGADPRWAEAIEAALVARGSIVLAGEEARVPGRDELPATVSESAGVLGTPRLPRSVLDRVRIQGLPEHDVGPHR